MDNLLFGLRLGEDPRLCVTTTPRPVRLVTDLIADPTTAIARGTTYENRAHLAPSFFERIVGKYEGTRLGQQELLAEVLEVSDGRLVPPVRRGPARDRGGRVRPAVPGAPGDRLRRLAARRRGLVPGAGVRPGAAAGDGLRRLPRRGPVLGGGGAGDPGAGRELPCRGRLDTVRLDPAAVGADGDRPDGLRRVRAGLRPAGARPMAEAPRHRRPRPARGPARPRAACSSTRGAPR